MSIHYKIKYLNPIAIVEACKPVRKDLVDNLISKTIFLESFNLISYVVLEDLKE